MDKQADRYFDFSDDEWLQAEFDPDDVHDLALKIYGAQLQKHLRLANPIAGIKGILALQHCMLAANTDAIQSDLSRIKALLVVIAALIGYIAYLLS